MNTDYDPDAEDLLAIIQRQSIAFANQMTQGIDGKMPHPRMIEASILRMYHAVAALNGKLAVMAAPCAADGRVTSETDAD